jgi:hypothetical protein
MCEYCKKSDIEILNDIMKNTVPYYSNCVWKRVCQVRGRNNLRVTKEMWSKVCSDRAYNEFANH